MKTYKEVPLPSSRQEWLEHRRTGLGGSDAGVILGVSPFNTPYSLWADKTGILIQEDKDNEKLRQGRDLEDYVASRFCEQTGKKVRKRNCSFQSLEYPWMLANIDRDVIGENAGLECKTTNVFSATSYRKRDIPLGYYCQCLHYMQVLGYDRMYLAVLVFGTDFHVFTIERSDPLVQLDLEVLIKAERNFWRLVQKRIPPDVDGDQKTSRALGLAYPADGKAGTLDLSDLEESLQIRSQMKEQVKELNKQITLTDNKVKSRMKQHTRANAGSFSVSWTEREYSSFDRKAFEKDYPNVYDNYVRHSYSRTFTVTERKK